MGMGSAVRQWNQCGGLAGEGGDPHLEWGFIRLHKQSFGGLWGGIPKGSGLEMCFSVYIYIYIHVFNQVCYRCSE